MGRKPEDDLHSLVKAAHGSQVRPNGVETRVEFALPVDCPDWGELDAQAFYRKFCDFYGLTLYRETSNLAGKKIGADGLLELFMQYQARRREHLARDTRSRQRRNIGIGALTLTALFVMDQQFDLHERAMDALDQELHPAPVTFVTYRPAPDMPHVNTDASRNNIDASLQSWLASCHAEAYVLTDCAEGRPYSGRATCSRVEGRLAVYTSGECGEQFFGLTDSRGGLYSWKEAGMGSVQRYLGLFAVDRHFDDHYHPVSPSPAEQCKKGENGVFIAPVVPDSVQDLPEACLAPNVHPLARKGLFE